ncbi:MAG: thiolase family protein [Acidobacteriota bacterium]
MYENGSRRVAVVAGLRTPFVKSRTHFEDFSPLKLSTPVVEGLLDRADVDPATVQLLVAGAVVPEPGRPNLAREIVLETDLPRSLDAWTLSSYCITGLRAVTSVAEAIAAGRIDSGIALGVESLSSATRDTFREPSTGLLMGEHAEITRRAWEITREDQDRWAFESHRRAVAAQERMSSRLLPLAGAESDTGPRPDTSRAALAGLKPAFGDDGTITAGSASPISDGAAAVLLMSEERARREGREPLAFLRASEFGGVDIVDGLLMAPGVIVPRLLNRIGVPLHCLDLIEIHEAFAAQVLANVRAWERGWKEPALGEIDWDVVNVNGGSVALGHPWSATGVRLVSNLAYEMAERDVTRGLISACAGGGLGGALLLERR